MNCKITKYNIVSVDCTDYKAEILFTTIHYNDAVEFVNKHLDEYDLKNGWLKCYHENSSTVSIYQTFWLSSKKLLKKIHILEFPDIPCELVHEYR